MKFNPIPALVIGFGLCGTPANLVAAVTLTTLHSFNSNDGASPNALVQGSDGNFYGTTELGAVDGGGTVFVISPSGAMTNLHQFSGQFIGGSSDGYRPYAKLLQGSDSNFYGMTSYGGDYGFKTNGGTLFQINANGSYATLYSFNFMGANYPSDGLIQTSDGNFYGTTLQSRGSSDAVFRFNTNDGLTTLRVLNGPPGQGSTLYAGLVQGSDGNFYGTTYLGGQSNNGTVFQVSSNGNLTTLHSFGLANDPGFYPAAGLVQDNDGNLYGTTSAGGFGNGTVFRISTNGTYTNLASFPVHSTSIKKDIIVLPKEPGLIQGSDGNFYGMTSEGGTSTNCGVFGCGTVYRVTPSGGYTTLYSFSGSDGSFPDSDLVQGIDGSFYGTTESGGTNGGYGTVFKLVVPLNPPANQISSIQVVAPDVLVTVPSVAGATYQLQYRDSLATGAWSNVVGVVTKSIGGPLTITNFGSAVPSKRYYRFSITP